MTDLHLAHLNVARLAAPIDSAQLADFVNRLDEINGLGESSPGFVWRYETPGTVDYDVELTENGDLFTMSVWTGLDEFWHFVYRSAHIESMRKRRQFFLAQDQETLVLWWIPAGTVPTLDEGVNRLHALRSDGPGPDAFTFRRPYDAQGRPTTLGEAKGLDRAER